MILFEICIIQFNVQTNVERLPDGSDGQVIVGVDRTNKIPQTYKQEMVVINENEKYRLLILTRSMTASSTIKLAEEIGVE